MSELSLLRAEVHSALGEFIEASDEPRPRAALDDVHGPALQQPEDRGLRAGAARLPGRDSVCGIVGYKNDTPFSIGRHLRDTMSASLMVANERIHETNATLLLIAKDV